jgi:integrase/recombinase XerD
MSNNILLLPNEANRLKPKIKQKFKFDSEDYDIHNYAQRLRLAYSKIQKEECLSDEDKELLTKFAKYLEAMDLNPGRTAKAIYQLIVLKRHLLCKSFLAADRKAIEELVTWINRDSHYRPWTKSDAKGWIKRFYKWLKEGTTEQDRPFPPEVVWIKTNIKKNELTQPEILSADEAKTMISIATRMRDKAFIAVGHDGGFRIGEMLGIKIHDIEFDDHGARIKVSGKTGGRVVTVIASAPLLARYLDEHPYKDDSNSPLWVSYTTNFGCRPMSYFRVTCMLKSVARKAKIKKRIHTHIFRHSAATRDATFLTDRELVLKYGWDPSSKMPARYAHLSGRDLDSKLIAVYTGQKIQQKVPDFAPILCPRCNEKNSPGLRFCGKCGVPLDEKELVVASIKDQEVIAELTDVRKMLKEILSRPASPISSESSPNQIA